MSEEASIVGPEDAAFVASQDAAVQRIVSTPGMRPTTPSVQTPPSMSGRGLHGNPPGALEVPAFRVVVATDFAAGSLSAQTAPMCVLRAFALMFTSGHPVNLIFAVDHEAGESDVLSAQLLIGHLPADRPLAGVSIESFDEVKSQPTYAAVIPTGDPKALVTEVGATVLAMHLLAETIANPGRLRIAMVHQRLIARRKDAAVAKRLDAYREVPFPEA